MNDTLVEQLPLLGPAARAFGDRYQHAARFAAVAPGRVNLIGEHTDYNEGFVLPMAIDRHLVAMADPTTAPRRRLRVRSSDLDSEVELPLPDGESAEDFMAALRRARSDSGLRWARYVAGVVAEFVTLCQPATLPPLDVLLMSDLPLGAGLSSSAALEVAMASLLEAASGTRLTPLQKAQLCQRAERDWAEVPCGIMDQLASSAAPAGGALLIDCRSLQWQEVPLPDEVAVLVTSSQVQHALDDGAYAQRTRECAEAARLLGVRSLRDTDRQALDLRASQMPPLLVQRARHVLTENERTLQAAAALSGRNLEEAGRLLGESHRSLRDDFQVSCPELDALVDAAAEIGLAGGVLGARMTGGGFGGSTVTLVRREQAAVVAPALAAGFARRTGLNTTPFLVRAVAGARLVSLP